MAQPVKWSSQQGLLLVEAVLSAVVIAVGLVFVSRSLSSELGAVRSLETSETMLALARNQLLELEAERVPGPPPAEEPSSGVLTASEASGADSTYRWAVTASQREDLDRGHDGRPLFCDVTLDIRRDDPRHPASSSLTAIWPVEWVPSEWLQQ